MRRTVRTLRPTRSRALAALAAVGLLSSMAISSAAGPPAGSDDESGPSEPHIVPAPVSMETTDEVFTLQPDSTITVDPGPAGRSADLAAAPLAQLLRTATGYQLPVARSGSDAQPQAPDGEAANIHLTLGGDKQQLGQEGYELDVHKAGVRLAAATDEGLFRGIQTLRQLLPADIESGAPQAGPWQVPGVQIVDYPRYEWRGAHLDVARHFLEVDEVKRYIDLLALYKINRFHLHLSDDQGWRIQIDSWPDLTRIGGSSEVDGGDGGFFTKEDYADIVRHAERNHITVVPEIDVPGHTNAAEVSYPELNSCRPDNLPSHRLLPEWEDEPHYTGIEVGFSALCVHDEVTYAFMDDVIREVAEMTPGPYLHVGGDEAHETPTDDYVMFMDRVRDIVEKHDKTMVGWAELAQANPPPGSIAQNWTPDAGSEPGGDLAREAVAKDMNVIMSPANRIYLDMKYTPDTPPDFGADWAGTVDVRQSYEWDPGAHVDGVTDENVIGVEAALWTETIENIDDAEHLAYPRLPGAAEAGWTPQSGRDWDDYRNRLAAQADRWDRLGVNYYRSPLIWPDENDD